MRVNLSRIHSMIKNINADISMQMLQLGNTSYTFTFPILQKTTEADFNRFKDGISKKKDEFFAFDAKIESMLDYVTYLKTTLDAANYRHGISAKLLELNRLKSKLARKRELCEFVKDGASSSLVQIKDVDFYKTTYTDTVKSYDLLLMLFTQEDVAAYKIKTAGLEKAIHQLEDNIAELNQTTFVEITEPEYDSN